MTATAETYREVLDQVCKDVVAVEAAGVDQDGSFPTRSVAALGSAGLLGAMSAREVGGLALGPAGAAAIVERLAMDCGSTAMVVCMHYSGVAVLEAYGPPAVRRKAATGDHLSTLAFSEAGSRSQFWAPLGTARRNGTGVVLNAHKSFVTSASRATAYVWSSRPLEAAGMSTLWLVPTGVGGLSVPSRFDGLGLRGNDSSPVTASEVHVPASAMLGRDGQGFDVMLQVVLPLFNVLNAACSVGFMEAAVTRTAAHAADTRYEHLGSALADLPTVRNYVGRMRVETDSARTLLQDTIDALATGRPDAMLRVLECKAAAGESATSVLDTAMRVCGGAAFRKDVGVERLFRDARAASVMGPTTDVLYDFIGKLACGMDLF